MRGMLKSGYLIHSRKFTDTALLLDVLTEDAGRLSLVARGSGRRAGQGLQRSLLQPFHRLLFTYGGRAEQKTLYAVEPGDTRCQLSGQAIFCGLYLNELIMRVTPREDPCPGIFCAYVAAIDGLVQCPSDSLDLLLRDFEMQLLVHSGYAFDLTVDGLSGAAIACDRRYQFDPEAGLVALPADTDSVGLHGGDLLAIAAGEFTAASRAAFKQLTRSALAPLLGGRPLRSRELFGGPG